MERFVKGVVYVAVVLIGTMALGSLTFATPPVVKVEWSQSSCGKVSFVSNCYDPDSPATQLNYSWSFGFGSFCGVPSGAKNPVVVYPQPGTYNVSLRVTEQSTGEHTTWTGTVSLSCAGNWTPWLWGCQLQVHTDDVRFFIDYHDYNGTEPSTHQVIIDDGLYRISMYKAWGTPTGPNGSEYRAIVKGLAPGTHTYEFHFVDSGGLEAYEYRCCGGSFTIPGNRPPAASFDYTPTYPLISQDVLFTSTSYDPDGTIKSWEWSFGDGRTGSGLSTTHKYDVAGPYSVTLTVTDDQGAKASATKDVLVVSTQPNQPPIASFGWDPGTPRVGEVVAFDSTSSDPDGVIQSWEWSFGDGKTGSGSSVTHKYEAKGTYSVTLTVIDDRGAASWATKDVSVVIEQENKPPLVSFTWVPGSPLVGQQVSFTSTSSDPDGTIKSWAWSFGDGATASGASPTHAYGAKGTYSVWLTVTDDAGATRSATKILSVGGEVPKGSLRVYIDPPEARAAGAVWRLAGTSDWLTTGHTVAGLTPGIHAVEFKPITGWVNPEMIQVTVASSATTSTKGIYLKPEERCEYRLSDTQLQFSAEGGTVSIQIQTSRSGCHWSVEVNSGDAWISDVRPTSGSGSQGIAVSVKPNEGRNRMGSISIAGQPVTVYQQASASAGPQAPSLLAVRDVDGHVRLEWSLDPSVVYKLTEVQRKSFGPAETFRTERAVKDESTWEDTGAEKDVGYVYQVRSVGSDLLWTPYSNAVIVLPVGPAPLPSDVANALSLVNAVRGHLGMISCSDSRVPGLLFMPSIYELTCLTDDSACLRAALTLLLHLNHTLRDAENQLMGSSSWARIEQAMGKGPLPTDTSPLPPDQPVAWSPPPAFSMDALASYDLMLDKDLPNWRDIVGVRDCLDVTDKSVSDLLRGRVESALLARCFNCEQGTAGIFWSHAARAVYALRRESELPYFPPNLMIRDLGELRDLMQLCASSSPLSYVASDHFSSFSSAATTSFLEVDVQTEPGLGTGIHAQLGFIPDRDSNSSFHVCAASAGVEAGVEQSIEGLLKSSFGLPVAPCVSLSRTVNVPAAGTVAIAVTLKHQTVVNKVSLVASGAWVDVRCLFDGKQVGSTVLQGNPVSFFAESALTAVALVGGSVLKLPKALADLLQAAKLAYKGGKLLVDSNTFLETAIAGQGSRTDVLRFSTQVEIAGDHVLTFAISAHSEVLFGSAYAVSAGSIEDVRIDFYK